MTSAIIKTGLIISSLISPPQSEFNDQIYFFKRDKGNPESWIRTLPPITENYFKNKNDSTYYIKLNKEDFPNLPLP